MRKSVLWGHHYKEYCDMFDLTPHDACTSLLEWGSGPSAFNAERTDANQRVVSCDPLFSLERAQLQKTVLEAFEQRAHHILNQPHRFDFSQYGGAQVIIAHRKAGIETFLADYERGRNEGRYVAFDENHVALPFAPFEFDLALSSHYFFSGLEEDTLAVQVDRILALTKVAKEGTIFPLIDKDGLPSPLLGPVILELMNLNLGVEVKTVPYHVEPKGNAMLRVWAQTCERL